jgi:hypothetical protein
VSIVASTHPVAVNAAQRAFLEAAEALGAISPARAQPLSAWPRLSAREFDELVARGFVREAGAGTYYAYTPRWPSRQLPRPGGPVAGRLPVWHAPWFRAVVFWLVLLLIPAVLLFLMRE